MTHKKTKSSMKKSKPIVVIAPSAKKKKNRGRKKANVPEMLGKTIGGMIAGPRGSRVGSTAGKLISRITGSGDYKINRNSIVQGNSIPTFQQGGDGVRICHREFITDITGQNAFLNRVYAINPGLASTFPLLSCLADCYEEYEFKGLVFQYVPTSGTALTSASAALGVVVLATNYDALDPPFSTKQQMESYEYANSTVPFEGCIHPVECARNRNVLDSLYVRTGAVPPGGDVRMYDQGNFQLSTQGMQSAYPIGELWVSYDVLFRKPRLNSPTSGYMHFYASPGSSASNTNMFGSSGALTSANSDTRLNVFYVASTNSLLFKSIGRFLVFACVVDSSTSGLNYTIGGNIISGFNAFNFNVDPLFNVSTAGAGNMFGLSIFVTTNGDTSANYLTFTSGAYTGGNFDVYVFATNVAGGPLLYRSPPLGMCSPVPAPPALVRSSTPFVLIAEEKKEDVVRFCL